MRINRYLALAGRGARRKCEELVRQGRIEVNGETISRLSFDVDPDSDLVTCDGERLRPPRKLLYAVMNKPSGVVVTAEDERGRTTVYDLLPGRLRGKLRAVGRLDRASEGLLLFTNDGILAHALLHPSRGIERTYMAWVRPGPDAEAMRALRSGVQIGPRERSGPAEVRALGRRGGGTGRVRVTIREGKNREIRRMFRAVGVQVLALRRIRFDGLELGELGVGSVRPLSPAETRQLEEAAGLKRGA